MGRDRPPTSHERRAGRPWDASYSEGTPPWDFGGPQPAIVRLCDQGAFAGPLLDAGCGSGENALEIARRGIEVTGFDVAPTAIRQAEHKAAGRGIAATFLVADALRLERLGATFRSVLDCGLFHIFDDEERSAYVESLTAVTAPGSELHVLCFSDLAPGEGGPRRVSQAELRTAFADGWEVVSIAAEGIQTTAAPAPVPAWLARITRRGSSPASR
jgi:SAM-dependent methyltransferase